MESTESERALYHEAALESLVKDVELLERGTFDWIKGNNYLVTLEWSAGNLEKAFAWFCKGIGENGNYPLEKLLDFKNSFKIGNSDDRFVRLNQLRLLALAQKNNKLEIDASPIVEYVQKVIGSSEKIIYPANLILKWALVLLHERPERMKMFESLSEKWLKVPSDEPVIELMRWIDIQVYGRVVKTGNIKNSTAVKSLKAELEAIDSFRPFIEVTETDLFSIAKSLPYYYA